ncbi:MAG TPA: hypothetical protein VF420_13740 [Casimicrobiaceae bacterium]
MSRRSRSPHPTIDQLITAPELAILAALEDTLRVATLALAAAWPEIQEVDLSPDEQPRTALDVIESARALTAAVNRYRLALAVDHARDQDLPF